jgi:hypothetical protein
MRQELFIADSKLSKGTPFSSCPPDKPVYLIAFLEFAHILPNLDNRAGQIAMQNRREGRQNGNCSRAYFAIDRIDRSRSYSYKHLI